jgi:hypothetical protein
MTSTTPGRMLTAAVAATGPIRSRRRVVQVPPVPATDRGDPTGALKPAAVTYPQPRHTHERRVIRGRLGVPVPAGPGALAGGGSQAEVLRQITQAARRDRREVRAGCRHGAAMKRLLATAALAASAVALTTTAVPAVSASAAVQRIQPPGPSQLSGGGVATPTPAAPCPAHIPGQMCRSKPVPAGPAPAPSGSAGSTGGGFPHGYGYYYEEYIGAISLTGSPAHVMKLFEDNPAAVFPFPISGCSKFRAGSVCALHAGPSFAGGNGTVRVSLPSPASFRFTVISHRYFDAPGSTITFSLGQSGGILYLSQHGISRNTRLIPEIAIYLGYTESVWQQQARNLQYLLGVEPFAGRAHQPVK